MSMKLQINFMWPYKIRYIWMALYTKGFSIYVFFFSWSPSPCIYKLPQTHSKIIVKALYIIIFLNFGSKSPCLYQYIWNIKKISKVLIGSQYAYISRNVLTIIIFKKAIMSCQSLPPMFMLHLMWIRIVCDYHNKKNNSHR